MAIDRTALGRLLESVYRGPAWHGPTVLGALKKITPREAARSAGRGRPTIHQLVLHLAYSRYLVRSRLRGTPGPRFERPLAKSWWPKVQASLVDDLGLLELEQARLLATLRSVPARRLGVVRHDRGYSLGEELLGHVVHDGYHAGQIVLLRKMRQTR